MLVFISKDKMYKIENIGSNKNIGVTIDYYKTRNMVLKHWPPNYYRHEISKNEFKELYERIFTAYKEVILSSKI